MKILLVCNNYFGRGNGLCSSARTTVKYLREAGNEVRVLSMTGIPGVDPLPDYPLRKFNFPIFQGLIEKQTFCFAKSDKKVFARALEWADVVHVEETFVIQAMIVRMARKMGVPCVGTYHMHPENIMSSLGMGRWRFGNALLLKAFQNIVYDWCSDIQCPTAQVAARLRGYRFKADLHLIPNGMRISDAPVDFSHDLPRNPYRILCTGRLSVEKDQWTLLRAMRYCRNADNIQLIFAGRGPKEKSIKRLAARLVKNGVIKNPPSFVFVNPQEYREICRNSWLYIHCANIEVEGLSCLEALLEGAVPVIAEGRLTATSQFALDSRSKFPAGNAKVLAERIDWWIEHPEERMRMGAEYSASVAKYEIHKSIDLLQQMYASAIAKMQNKQ